MGGEHTSTSGAAVMVCPGCDLLLEHVDVEPGISAFCPRCSKKILTSKHNSIDKTLALAMSGLILFIPANFLPLMTLNKAGFEQSGTIAEGFFALWATDYWFVAMMLGLTSAVFPLIKLFLLFIISLQLKLRRYSRDLPMMMRCYLHLDEWGMLEVYMLGILVTIIKMHHMAHIDYNAGFFCFAGLLFVALCSSAAMDEHLYWDLIEKRPD